MAQPQHVDLVSLPDLICSLRGEVLLTAPHSLTLPPLHRKEHLRERGTAQLAVSLAKELQKLGFGASAMIWNCFAQEDAGRLDPNYLQSSSFADSEWHCALHRWVHPASDSSIRFLHLDIHGKITDDVFLDVGFGAMENLWPQRHQAFVSAFKCSLAKVFDATLMQRQVFGPRGNLMTVQIDPRLNGFRADGFTTMSMQTAMLGIPSVQLELPAMLREQLMKDAALCCLLAHGIAEVYRETVVPWWRGQDHVCINPAGSIEPLSSDGGGEPELFVGGLQEEWDEDDPLVMLGGMADGCELDDATDEQLVTEVDDRRFPALCHCEAWVSTVHESGPGSAEAMEQWYASVLASLNQWEEISGAATPAI